MSKKKEVDGVINPRELSKEAYTSKIRNSNFEMNNRDTFFNQNNVEITQEFDHGRDMYDGYNYKAGHNARVTSLEHSWRESLCQPTRQKASSNIPDKLLKSNVSTTRSEMSEPFRTKKANKMMTVMAQASRISLPFLNDATLRSQATSCQKKSPMISQGNAIASNTFSNVDHASFKTGRLEEAVDPKAGDHVMQGPIVMKALDHQNLMRENGAVTPIASREWNMIQKISQGIDHLKEDDSELANIVTNSSMKGEAKSPEQSFDHIVDRELHAQTPSHLHSQVIGNPLKSNVTLVESREMIRNDLVKDSIVNVGKIATEIAVNGTDAIESNVVRTETQIIANINPGVVSVDGTDAKEIEATRKEVNFVATSARGQINVTGADVQETENHRFDVMLPEKRHEAHISATGTDSQQIDEERFYFENAKRVVPAQAMDENDRQQAGHHSLKSVMHASAPINAKAVVKPVQKPIDRMQHAENTISAKRTHAHQDISSEYRGTHEINRPGDTASFFTQSHTMTGPSTLPGTQRSKENTKETNPFLEGKALHAFPMVKVTKEPSLYARIAKGETQTLNQPVRTHTQPTNKIESGIYARTNSGASSVQASIRTLPQNKASLSGLYCEDRIHSPHPQNWHKTEKMVQQSTSLSQDRSMENRIPSRSSSTPVRWTPTLQIESKREMNPRGTPSQSTTGF